MGNWCPFSKGKCKQTECKFWIHLLGKNPQGTDTIDTFDCAISFLPILLVENAQMARQNAAAIESTRNVIANPKGGISLLANQLARFNLIAERNMIMLDKGVQTGGSS